ncbi:MAG TPA: PD-(D/E)XK nuclease family protein [Terracidiphilus sp.]|nr:PD-(D/E)XK nuclease family protein [Terracidiphilus sp.]
MGALAAVEMDAWLRQGGRVVTASERAARALATTYHRARLAEGLAAWNAPNIQDWNSFVRTAWAARSVDGRLLLNPAQEQSVWAGIAASDGPPGALLEGPRFRLASLAMEAHQLLCTHSPRLLRASARAGWQNDAAAFSRWLAEFDETCRKANLLSPARLPLELLELLNGTSVGAAPPDRLPLLLAGFDRILPVQRAVFDARGDWREAVPDQPARQINFHQAASAQEELAACALWCGRQLAAEPGSRILIVTQDVSTRRGQIERAFLHCTGSAHAPLFEFSLGISLSQVPLVRAGTLLLRWLSGPLAEHELDWLHSTGHAAANPGETAALQARMRALRSRGLERPAWTLDAFLTPFLGQPEDNSLPAAWSERTSQARLRLGEASRRPQSPLEWAELVPQMLESLHFAEAGALSSAEFQAARRWQQALETAASLGFDGRRIEWKDFLSALARTLDETLFAPESRDAPIQIAGPAESAGLTADAVWFLGASEDAWPAGGATHPLLPPEVQREAKMPHASPQLDWDLAQAITARLLASGTEVHFSYARQVEGAEARPSGLIVQVAGPAQPLPAELAALPIPAPITIPVEDFSRIPHALGRVRGGAAVLTSQSQCPFQAFATARLEAKNWEPAQAGLTPAQRGKLLHEVLHSVWGGPSRGIRTHAELLALANRESWVAGRVERAFAQALPAGVLERMPSRYLELEQQRLVRLVAAWLHYESARAPFEVLETEAKREVTLAGLTFKLRLDRLDGLKDGSVLVVDYKSGNVSPNSWDPPRPEDVQLPLYAGFALDPEQELGGLVFAKLRPGELGFAGRVGDAAATLHPDLTQRSSLVSEPLSAEMLIAWKDAIEQLAEDFLAGKAEVDPREYPKTCERCGLQTLCRIQENHIAPDADEDSGDEEGANA